MTGEHYVATLEERVLDLMSDGDGWTVKLLARTLDVSQLRIRIRLRALVAASEVHIVRTAGRGSARTFKYGPPPSAVVAPSARKNRSTAKPGRWRWPELDPLLDQVIRAMVRRPG